MAEIAPGVLLDSRYKVLSRLGSGGMADVYLAEDQQLGRKVALKLLHRRFAEDPDFVERFRREAQSAAGLQHPNVVSVYDRGAYDGTYYIAMEYLPGRTLKALIRQEAPVEPIRAIDITIQILKAARFAHRRGVIHRDLKPHNVIIDDADQAKVTDFGIARAGASDMTETGSIMGTAQYLSPEQAQGHAVSEGSDLYSVGVVLYELLTGRVPFDAEAAVTIALKHVSEAPAPPSSFSPAVPAELEQVVLWSLNKDPADRPADADQFITALEQARAAILAGSIGQQTASMPLLGLAGAGIADVPPTTVYPAAGPPLAIDEPPLQDAALVPLAEPVAVQEEESRAPRWPWALLLLLLIAGAIVAALLLTGPANVTVPTVVNLPVATAQTNVQNAGLTPNLITRQASKPAGTVIAQNPLAGTKVNKGSTVTLTVSSGPGSVVVPSVVGLTEAQAMRALKLARLTVGHIEHQSSADTPAGSAIRTDPASGQQLPARSAVTLFISAGPARVTVPDETGQSEASARGALEARGFTVTTSSQESSTATAGTVLSQSPTGGSRVDPSSTVNLVIAKAPATIAVPDVKGNTSAAATSALQAAGLTVTPSNKDVTNQKQDGVVLSQDPAAGKQVRKGSAVTIVVGRYKPPPTPTTPTGPRTTPKGP